MDLIAEVFRHHAMMNQRLLAACRELTPDQLGTAVEGTYGGIGATLVHVANSQVGYATRFLGEEKPEPLPSDPFPGFEALAARLAYGDELLARAAASNADHHVQVSGDDPPGTWRMPAGLLLLQAVNHATEHRSQIATILTQLGVEPPAMDGWTYFFAAGHMEDV